MIVVLGSAESANLIYTKRSGNIGNIPQGWHKVGEGSFRSVYLAPDGFVYKVAHEYNRYPNNNDEEFENYCAIVNSGKTYRGWRIPKVYAHRWRDEEYGANITVNVMEFVKGIHEVGKDEPDEPFRRFGLYDAQVENYVLSDDGRRYIIDLAC